MTKASLLSCALLVALSCPVPARAEDEPAPTPWQRDRALQAQAKDRLHSGDYDFCTSENYRLWREDKKQLCEQTPELVASCPGLALACRKPAWEDKVQDEPNAFLEWLGRLLDGWGPILGLVARVLFWTTLAVGLGFLLRFLWRRLAVAARNHDTSVVEHQANAPLNQAFEGDQRSAGELLAAARALLERGEVRDALHLLYRATIVTLAENQLIRIHRSKTTRDYVSELEGGLRGEVQALTRALDEQRFRPGALSEPAAEALVERVDGLRGRTLIAQAAHVLPLLLLVLSGCGGVEIPEDPRLPRAPRGFALFEELLAHQATSVSKRVRRVAEVAEETNVVVALDAPLVAMDWKILKSWVEAGGALVVIAPNAPFGEVFALDGKVEACAQPLSAPELALHSIGPIPSYQATPDSYVSVSCGQRAVAEGIALGDGWIIRIASAELFQNRALGVADNATLALSLVDAKGMHVEFLGPWTGEGSNHPLESLRRAGLGTWAVHLLALLALYAFARGRRFGTPRDAAETPRRAFSEHVEALAAQYARAGASGFVLGRYAEWAWETLRRRVTSQQDTPHSLARAFAEGDANAAQLGRHLTLARKAGELGETEKQHLERFRHIESAVAETRGR